MLCPHWDEYHLHHQISVIVIHTECVCACVRACVCVCMCVPITEHKITVDLSTFRVDLYKFQIITNFV